jgi:PAS domain S-box-containing protein
MGLPRATLVTSVVTPRELDVVIDLPPSPTIGGRVRRALRAALHASETVDLLEEQRRELSEALTEARRSTEEIRALLDHLPDFVMIHRDGVILWMNRANLAALGYERTEEVAGTPLLELVEPAARDTIAARMRQPAGANLPEMAEVRLLARDGRVVVVEVSPSRVVSFEGRPARLVAGRDVTERVRMQQQLLIADRMASIGMLAAGVAHEVNNPLAYVLNNIEIAMRALAPLGDAASQSREVLGVALEGVDRIRTIVRDLLALSRVDDTAIGPIAALEIVQSTLALAGKDIEKRAVLTFEHDAIAPVAGSVARLGQVLLNLITNALESMRSDARSENWLRVAVRRSTDGGAVVEVTDNGAGIPAEHASRIFDPFFTTKPPGRGTGLGLAISQRLVAEMGGQLSFESTPGVGSTFRVTLAPWEPPVTRAGAPRTTEPPRPDSAAP